MQAGFLDRKDTEVRNLSHGEQRQLEIVLGLASDPKILLLDEPAAGLSSGESAEMAKFLMKLDPNLAILLIEHDMDVVFDVAAEISVLHFGEILETGTPQQIHDSAERAGNLSGDGVAHDPEKWVPVFGTDHAPGDNKLMAILEVQDIHTYYGDAYVLQGLSLTLEQGQILGLLGRNGVGKTTLVNSIVGFNPPRRGKIVFKGDDITQISSFETVRGGMGLVPQGRRVFPTLGVEENLLVAERNPERHGWSLERVYTLFPRLHERRNQRAKTLSGGEQQMLAIGRALMTNPDCLIMDEPSEGLAPIIIQGLWEAIGKLKEQGLSILLVEQNANLALKLVDYVHVMSKGQVVYSGEPAGTAGQRRDQVELSGDLGRTRSGADFGSWRLNRNPMIRQRIAVFDPSATLVAAHTDYAITPSR